MVIEESLASGDCTFLIQFTMRKVHMKWFSASDLRLLADISTKFWDDGKHVDFGYFSVRNTLWKGLMIGFCKYFVVEVTD